MKRIGPSHRSLDVSCLTSRKSIPCSFFQEWYRQLSSLQTAIELGRSRFRPGDRNLQEGLSGEVVAHTSLWWDSKWRDKSNLDFIQKANRETLGLDSWKNTAWLKCGDARSSEADNAGVWCRWKSLSLPRIEDDLQSVAWGKLCTEGRLTEAFHAVDLGRREGLVVSRAFLCRLLKGCIEKKDLELGRRVHALCVECGYGSNSFLAVLLIRMYAVHGSLREANEVFSKQHAPDAFVWASIISAHVELGKAQQALELYQQMRQTAIRPNDYTIVAVLKACISRSDLAMGKLVHADVVVSGLESNVFVGTTLVDMYAKCRSLKDARRVFDAMPRKNVITWSSLIAGYAHHGQGEEALHLFSSMQQKGMTADKLTFVAVLKACGSIAALQEGTRIHAQIVEAGLETDMFVASSLVDMYVKCGDLVHARTIFDVLPTKDVVIWGAMLAGYAQHDLGAEVLELYASMPQDGKMLDNTVVLVSILKACGTMGAIQEGMRIHARIQERFHEADVFVGSALVDMYAKCGSLENARSVFNSLANRNAVTWNTMIAGYVQEGLGQDALSLYTDMQQDGAIVASDSTFVSILKACGSLGAILQGKEIHAQVQERGVQVNGIIGTSLVDMYAKCGSLVDARKVFDRCPTKTKGTWNAMISGYTQHGRVQDALDLYASMQQQSVTPDEITFATVLKACGSIGAIQEGTRVHAQILESGLKVDPFVGSALVDMYTKCGSLEDAHKLFNTLSRQDVVTWNALMNGYGQHNDCKMAMQCFEDMAQHGVKPDAATFISLLVACSHVGYVVEGRQYFTKMVEEHGITPTVEHYHCMVDLLGRAGHLHDAEALLQSMPFKQDNVGWIALLSACKAHNDIARGRRCFDRLVELEPSHGAGYVLMVNMYESAGKHEDARHIQHLRTCAGAVKKPARATIEIDNKVHEFIVGEERDDISSKLRSLNVQMREDETHKDLLSEPITDSEKEDALCGHAEKLAVAFGLLNTPEGSTLLLTKDLRMCNDCHNGTKMLSRLERREIIVRDAHRVHHFKAGLCSCGDSR